MDKGIRRPKETAMAEYRQIRRARTIRQAIVAALLSWGAVNVAVTAVTLSQL
jgi:hypothetical protein